MRKASFTIDFESKEKIYEFENWLQSFFEEPINITILPDTSNLYKTDETFRQLVKAEKDAKKLKADYIINSKKKEYINSQKTNK